MCSCFLLFFSFFCSLLCSLCAALCFLEVFNIIFLLIKKKGLLLLISDALLTSFFLLFYCNSETVKFGHVTFFWNGNRSGYFNEGLEEYVEIPSDSGITFNVQPKMKALEIGEKVRDAILSGKFDQVIH